MPPMKISDFDFALPPDLIAQFPLAARGASRLLHLDGISGALTDGLFSALPNFLRAGDVLVMNDTKVIKARLFGHKTSGGKVEVLVERVLGEREALAAIRASHAPRDGQALWLADAVQATVVARRGEFYHLRFEGEIGVVALLDQHGKLPLPPYITRAADAEDEARYQTVYAAQPGAVAAPTAGLHFDEAMLEKIRGLGVTVAKVTLHVGAGTFQPVRAELVADHKMHRERFDIPEATVTAIARARASGGRILAVGTTTLRALESAAQAAGEAHGQLRAGSGETEIFITPGFQFRVVERLLTNFHLPRSTLLMLVSAFGGAENIRRAYQHAIAQRYRFFSYGDAMLIERQ